MHLEKAKNSYYEILTKYKIQVNTKFQKQLTKYLRRPDRELFFGLNFLLNN
jgi:hypothetical protein